MQMPTMLVEEFNMGPNITLTAFDGLVMFGPFIAMTILIAIGSAVAGNNKDD